MDEVSERRISIDEIPAPYAERAKEVFVSALRRNLPVGHLKYGDKIRLSTTARSAAVSQTVRKNPHPVGQAPDTFGLDC
jgi:hypothetical protein